jgi:hypothetical protein
MTKEEYAQKAFEMAESNHIWLNAFSCINPSKEFCENLGRTIIEKIKQKDYLMPSWYGESEKLDEIAKLTPMMYMSINKS